MMTEAEDLRPTLQQVEEYLKQEGFTIFYGYETTRSRYIPEVVWSEEKSGWKGFLRAAKAAGTKVVVVQTSSPEGRREEAESAEAVKELNRYLGKIGYIGLFWFKEGVKYSFTISTDWWLQFSVLAATRYAPEVGERSLQVSDDVRKKSEMELADEIVAFMQRQFPNEVDDVSFLASRMFWESKGIRREVLPNLGDPKLELKIRRADALAESKLRQETQKKEKQAMPELVEECVSWAKENQLKKVNKTNLDCFLDEKKLTLSRLSRDILQGGVNAILGK